MNHTGIKSLIESATSEGKVDLKLICQTLDIKISIEPNLKDLCKIGLNESKHTTIWLNPQLDKKTKFTLVAIAMAEYIIHPERVIGAGVTYDVFFLRELNTNKATKLIMLATRFAMPEDIIEKIASTQEIDFMRQKDKEQFDVSGYIENSNYLPEFIRCAIKESTGKFLIDNLTLKT